MAVTSDKAALSTRKRFVGKSSSFFDLPMKVRNPSATVYLSVRSWRIVLDRQLRSRYSLDRAQRKHTRVTYCAQRDQSRIFSTSPLWLKTRVQYMAVASADALCHCNSQQGTNKSRA